MNIDNLKYNASIYFDVKTYEIDAAGHVNNIVYIKWLEDLRNKLFEQFLPVQSLLKRKMYAVVTKTYIKYKKQLRFGDSLLGSIRVESIRHNIMILKIDFTRGKILCASAEQNCVIMNLESGTMDKKILKDLFAKQDTSHTGFFPGEEKQD